MTWILELNNTFSALDKTVISALLGLLDNSISIKKLAFGLQRKQADMHQNQIQHKALCAHPA